MTDFDSVTSHEPRDLARGSALFHPIGCAGCHTMNGRANPFGPDLTGVGARFDRRALVESILEPSRVVAEQYRIATVTMKNGEIIAGRVVTDDGAVIVIAPNPVDLSRQRPLAHRDAAGIQIVSLMPPGLVNGLKREEILDLVAWLEAPAGSR